MEKSQQVLIGQILLAIDTIHNYTKQVSKEDFMRNQMVRDAVLMQLQLIGELAKGLAENFKNSTNSIAWNKIIGLRNVISHEYLGIDLNRIWNTVQNNLPPLQEVLEKALDAKS